MGSRTTSWCDACGIASTDELTLWAAGTPSQLWGTHDGQQYTPVRKVTANQAELCPSCLVRAEREFQRLLQYRHRGDSNSNVDKTTATPDNTHVET